MDEFVGFSLLIWSNAKDSVLFPKGLIELKDLLVLFAKGLIELKDLLVLEYLVKDITTIEPIRLSKMKWLLKTLILVISCKYYKSHYFFITIKKKQSQVLYFFFNI
jgi:hypothetical protein